MLCYKIGDPLIAKKFMNYADIDIKDTLIEQIIVNGNEEFDRLSNGQDIFENDKFTYMYR